MMNCQEALELLYDILDKEASEIDQEQFQSHLKQCKDCFDVYKLEESFQALVDEKLGAAKSTPKLDQLKANIIAELDSIDLQQNSLKVPRRFGYTTWTFIAAASLIITIGAAFFTSDMIRHYSVYAPLEKAHLDAIKHFIAEDTSSTTAGVLMAVQGQFGYSLDLEVGEFSLGKGYFENLQGVETAHLLYTNNGKNVSVFVAPADGFEIPTGDGLVRVLIKGREFFDHRCDGCRLVYHFSDKFVIVTATADNSIDLLSFVPGRQVL